MTTVSRRFFICSLSGLIAFTLPTACRPPHQPEVSYDDLEWKKDLYLYQGKPFTGMSRAQHDDGSPKLECPFKNGKYHGLVREWWETGKLSAETMFKDGKRHGENRYWDKDGNLLKEQTYENDKLVKSEHP